MSYRHHDGGRGQHGGGRGRYDGGGGGRGHFGGRGGRGGPPPPRPTECDVVVNYNMLTTLDPPQEVDVNVYKVAIKSARWEAQKDDNGNKKLNSTTGKPELDFVTRPDAVSADEKFAKRFFSSAKPWRIYKQLVHDQQKTNPSFQLHVSSDADIRLDLIYTLMLLMLYLLLLSYFLPV